MHDCLCAVALFGLPWLQATVIVSLHATIVDSYNSVVAYNDYNSVVAYDDYSNIVMTLASSRDINWI